MSAESVKITAIPVADAANVMASAYGRRVSEEQVRQLARRGNLIRADDTINLLEYVAYLVKEMAHGQGLNAPD